MLEWKLNATGTGWTQKQWIIFGIATAVVIIAGVIVYFKYIKKADASPETPATPAEPAAPTT